MGTGQEQEGVLAVVRFAVCLLQPVVTPLFFCLLQPAYR